MNYDLELKSTAKKAAMIFLGNMICQAAGKNQGNVSQVHKIQNPHAKINLLLSTFYNDSKIYATSLQEAFK